MGKIIKLNKKQVEIKKKSREEFIKSKGKIINGRN